MSAPEKVQNEEEIKLSFGDELMCIMCVSQILRQIIEIYSNMSKICLSTHWILIGKLKRDVKKDSGIYFKIL